MSRPNQNSFSKKTKSNIKSFPIGQFIRFGIVGFSGLFVDLVVFYLLRELFNLPLYLSTALSIEAAIVNNFLWNDVWTFAGLAKNQKDWRPKVKLISFIKLSPRFVRFLKFNSVCLAGALLQVGLMTLILTIPLVDRLPALIGQFISASWIGNANEYFAKVAAIALVTLWNFWLNLKLSWRN